MVTFVPIAASKQECYVAVDGTDTAYLNLNIYKAGNVDGDLLIKYTGKDQNIGKVAGKFSGDTLFVDYTFTLGNTDKPIYRILVNRPAVPTAYVLIL